MKIWGPKRPGTLWATLDLLQDSFYYTIYNWKVFLKWITVLIQVSN